MRGYVDMVADLFHIGHANQLRRVRELGYTVVVGVHSDDAVKAYKSSPVMAMAERVAAVEACKYADEVIPDAISASIMHSSCLFRQLKVNSAACASRCTAAQPFRSSHSASRRAQRSSAT